MTETVITCAIGGSKHGLYPPGELFECPCGALCCPDCVVWYPDGEGVCTDCAESAAMAQADRREQQRKV